MYERTYEFRVRFTYDHRRQTQNLDQPGLVHLLREDLNKMGIPHPPKSSIFRGPPMDGYPTIEFFWCTSPSNLICKTVPRQLADAPDHIKRKLAIISYEIFEKYVNDPGDFDIVHPPKITRDFVPNARYLSKLNEIDPNASQPPSVTVPSQPRRANDRLDTKPPPPVAPAAANKTKSLHGMASIPTGPAYLSQQQRNFQTLSTQDLKSGQQRQQLKPSPKRQVVPSQPAGGAGTSTPGKAPPSTVYPPRPAPYSKDVRPERRASLLAQPQSPLSPTSTPVPAIPATATATTSAASTVVAIAPPALPASTSTAPPSSADTSTTAVAGKEGNEQQQQPPNKATQLREKLEKARKSARGWRLVEKKCVTQLQGMGEDVVMEESVNEAEAARLRAQVEDLTRQLEEEKNARSNAERLLQDVERECKHPFIMPQLLQAFLQVANVTNQLEDSTA